jgi:hypothetical protein
VLALLATLVCPAAAIAEPVAPGAYDLRLVEAGFAAGGITGAVTASAAPTRVSVDVLTGSVALPPPSTGSGSPTPISGPGFSGTVTPTLSFVDPPSGTLNPADGSASGTASAWLELAFSGSIFAVPTSFTCTIGSALSPVALAPSTSGGSPYSAATGRLTLAQSGVARPPLTGGSSCSVIDLAVGSTLSFSLTYGLTPVLPPGGGPPVPSPPVGAAYVPAQAAVAPSRRTVPIRDDVVLDASGSLPPGAVASEFSWQLDGDPEPEITCGPETPVLQTSFRVPGTVSAQVTVTDARGARTTASTSLSVTGAAASPGASAAVLGSTLRRIGTSINRALPMAACVPSDRNTVAAIDVTGRGGPTAGCVTKVEARSALVAAVGCLRRATWQEVPAAERDLLFGQIETTWEGGAPPELDRAGGAQSRDKPDFALRRLIEDVVWIGEPGTTVRINGLDYTPAPGGTVVIVEPGLLSKSTPWVLSSRVEVTAPTSIRSVLLRRRGPLAIPARKLGFRIANIPVNSGVPFLPGTRLQGSVDVTLEQDRSRLRTRLRLPDDFEWATGTVVSAEAQMVATNANGIELDGFGIENVDAEILGVGVRIDYLRYVASLRRFEGKARVSFQPLGAIDATLHVGGSTIELLDITYLPGAPGIKVAPGVFLSEVNGFYESTPQVLRFGGGAAFTGGPSAGQGCGLVTARGAFDFRIDPAPITVTVDGRGSLVCIPLVRARAQIAADGYVSVGAGIDYELGPLRLRAGWDIRYYDLHFTAEAQAQGCLGDLGCATGTAVVSDRGLAFCAEFGPVDAGAGLDWPPGPSLPAIISRLSVMASGCDVGPWRTTVARPAQSGPATTFVVGGRGTVLGVVGTERPPRLRLRGPEGRVVEMPAQGPLRGEDLVAFRVNEERTTYVIISRPGTWTVETVDGEPLSRIRQAPVLDEPRVSGSVTPVGSGRRVLRYEIAPIPGQQVRFFERSGGRLRLIGAASGRSGTIAFTPLDAPGSDRRIVAAVEQGGRPRTQIDVARFAFTQPRIGRPGRVRATRRGSVLRIGFAPARGASAHLVGVLLSDGRSLQLRARPGSSEVRVRRVERGTVAQLRIAGVRGERRGPVARARVRLR